jgi:Fe-Mn family superoxide dismutase
MFYKNCKILFGLDMYEHSYYLNFRNNKEKYANAVISHLVNWDYANKILLS